MPLARNDGLPVSALTLSGTIGVMGRKHSVVGRCALCGNTRALRRSHIIPEFCYIGYDEHHRLIEVDRVRAKERYLQKGHRQPLLCDACEQLLNDRYEKSFRAAWLVDRKLPSVVSTAEVQITGLNYSTFKLFHLSVLWRAAVATEGEYKGVWVPPNHQEELRRMVFEGDPGDATKYPLLALALLLPPDGKPAFDLIQTTSYELVEGQYMYRTVYGASAWQVWVGDRLPNPVLSPFTLTLSGALLMPAVDARLFGPIWSVWQSHRQLAANTRPS
jgi:hypothetical protein